MEGSSTTSWMGGTATKAETMREDTLEEIDDFTCFNVNLFEAGATSTGFTTMVVCAGKKPGKAGNTSE